MRLTLYFRANESEAITRLGFRDRLYLGRVVLAGVQLVKSLYLEHEISVSTHEIDFAGHVSNIVYLRWLEDMRLKMFEIYCPLKQFVEKGVTPVLVSTEIQYKKPVRLFDKPLGRMWLSELGLSTLTIEAEISNAGVIATSARHVGVFVDMAKMKPMRVPKVFREAVEKFAASVK